MNSTQKPKAEKEHSEERVSLTPEQIKPREGENLKEAKEVSSETTKESEIQEEQGKQEEQIVTEEISTMIPPIAVTPAKDQLDKQLESLLAEDLTDIFLQMTPAQQIAFKAKGEETASKIREMINQTKVSARKIFHLIRQWLKMIPGVNKFFLEKEAKIKTDKIVLVAKEEESRQQDILT